MIKKDKEFIKKFVINPDILSDDFENLLIFQFIKLCFLIVIPIALFIVFLLLIPPIFGRSVTLDINRVHSLKDIIIFFSVPTILFLGILPILYELIIERKSLQDVGLMPGSSLAYTLSMITSVLILFASIWTLYSHKLEPTIFGSVILHNFAVGFGEEIFARSVILSELQKVFNTYMSVIIDALIFAFVLHSNLDMRINLLVRFPLGLILAFVAVKAKSIYPSIILHWSYNILVTLI
jgi:hypothetical protein